MKIQPSQLADQMKCTVGYILDTMCWIASAWFAPSQQAKFMLSNLSEEYLNGKPDAEAVPETCRFRPCSTKAKM